ncbi:MAG TPA: hypothetical protein VHB98_03825 [Chloroflexota bacterium]|nr:hypothetical protein [Chloroflexota bacterium]
MTWNTIRRLTTLVMLGGGIQGFSALGFGGTVSARPMIDPRIFTLHGSGEFSTSEATAIVARLSSDRFSLTLIAKDLPALKTLHLKVACHVYVAWLVNGNTPYGPTLLGIQGSMRQQGSGNYFGQRSVTVRNVTSVIITPEPAAQTFTPITPALAVLASAGYEAPVQG